MSDSLRDIEVYSAYLRFVDPPVPVRRGETIGDKRLTLWKRRRRGRDAKRVPLVACAWCGSANKLSRHHEWAKAKPHTPPPLPTPLCKPCHDTVEGWRPKICAGCGFNAAGSLEVYRLHVADCPNIERPMARQDRIESGW